jgi:predicted nucleic acid-binding Zn ribbon protein
MVCPGCGSEVEEGKNYCSNCGKKVTAQKVTVSKPDPYMIIFGIIIILVMYFIPVFPAGIFGGSLSLAGAFDQCSSPIRMMQCPGYIPLVYFGGWVCAIVLIVMGVLNKEKK